MVSKHFVRIVHIAVLIPMHKLSRIFVQRTRSEQFLFMSIQFN
ncbi:unnamed protein product [Paramecium octaurelia]|uniref:Uncharacterized protein n=1 Tax=Paramecium octaurelia TaxID=43137 RepID=A0A8S1TL87_PAROT|nr:unnamed protein product [Paramecium octaurelia]